MGEGEVLVGGVKGVPDGVGEGVAGFFRCSHSKKYMVFDRVDGAWNGPSLGQHAAEKM